MVCADADGNASATALQVVGEHDRVSPRPSSTAGRIKTKPERLELFAGSSTRMIEWRLR